MGDELAVFRGIPLQVTPKISICQPTLDEIRAYGEEKYFSLVRGICATPADRKVEIWDAMHVYWEKVDEYDLFLMTFKAIAERDASILFGDLDLTSFTPMLDPARNMVVLKNKDGAVIDRAAYVLMTGHLRAVHGFKKNEDVGFDDMTREVMVEDDRDEIRKQAAMPYKSFLKSLILAAVNCPEFKYRWDDVWTLPIGVFMDCIAQVQKHKSFCFTLQGVYSGCVDAKKVSKKDMSWIPS